MNNDHLVMGGLRQLGTVGLVAGLCGAYGAVLTMLSSMLGTISRAAGDNATGKMLGAVSGVFMLLALYVAVIVIINAVATVIGGRLHQLAMLRLLGSHAAQLRHAIMRSTAMVSVLGALIGTAIGVVASNLVRIVLVNNGTMPTGDYVVVPGALVLVIISVGIAGVIAGWLGSARVLQVSPAQAMGTDRQWTTRAAARGWGMVRAVVSLGLIGGGVGFLALAIALGEQGSLAGFMCAFLGAAFSGTGLLVGARAVIPRCVSRLGRLVGNDPAAVIARRNAVTDPLRTTRSTMGLVVGVTIITACASGLDAIRVSMNQWPLSAADRAMADDMLTFATAIIVCIVAISSVIAAVGFCSTMSLTVIQRGREIGMLRAMGFTTSQIKAMITKESIAMSATAISLGIVLGVIYGAVGAQALIGSQNKGLVVGLPWFYLGTITACGAVLVIAASLPPSRRAVRVEPIEALRIQA